MGYQLLTAPAEEPLALAEVKAHLRVDIADDDLLITALITAVRQFAEQLTARSLVTQTWQLVLDAFPGPGQVADVPWGEPYSQPGNALLLEKGPVQSITTVAYTDMSGAQQAMDAATYAFDPSGPLARITPRFGNVWPIALPQIGSVAVNFVAGYGAAAAVPQGIKSWMLLRLGAMYENREEIVVGQRLTSVELPFVDRLLDPYRIWRA